MKSIKKFSKKLLKNQSGQGMVEYILLLVIVVGLVMMFKNEIRSTIDSKVGELKDSISGVSGN